jgi:hypothetical protein
MLLRTFKKPQNHNISLFTSNIKIYPNYETGLDLPLLNSAGVLLRPHSQEE